MMRGMNGMHGMYGCGYGSIWMMVIWIAFWVILIGLGIYLLTKFVSRDNKNIKNNRHTNNNKDTPLQILQERLAKGEIDEAEYEHSKSIIKRDKE